MVTKFITFSPKKILTTLIPVTQFDNGLSYFENRNVIPSGFDSFRNTPKRNEKFRRATEIFKKNEEGASFASLLFEGSQWF